MGSRWGRSEGAKLEGENKKDGGGETAGWSKVINILNAPERPEQGD